MKPVVVERIDSNSETAMLTEWLVGNEMAVVPGQDLCTIETQKSIIVIPCPAGGWIIQCFQTGESVPFNVPVAFIAETREEIETAKQSIERPKAIKMISKTGKERGF